MAGPETPTALAAANARHRNAALAAARQAINDLRRSGTAVTFVAVAKTAGVSRSWLYEQADLRQLIGRLRDATPPPIADNERASTESLRRMADALRLELSHLREENRFLKEQIAHQLGDRRALRRDADHNARS